MEEQRNKVKSNKAKVKEKMSVINCCSVLICLVIKQPQNTKPCAWRIMNMPLATSTRRVNKALRSPGEKRKKDTTS